MSRWLSRLSSSSNTSRRSLDSNGSNGKVHARINQTHICPGFPTVQASWTLLRLNEALHDREEELSDRSYQLLVQKLQLCEKETVLAQEYEELIRQRRGSNQLQVEIQSLSQQWQEIQTTKSKLVEQHERLEAAIEAILVDKERLVEEYHMQFSVQ